MRVDVARLTRVAVGLVASDQAAAVLAKLKGSRSVMSASRRSCRRARPSTRCRRAIVRAFRCALGPQPGGAATTANMGLGLRSLGFTHLGAVVKLPGFTGAAGPLSLRTPRGVSGSLDSRARRKRSMPIAKILSELLSAARCAGLAQSEHADGRGNIRRCRTSDRITLAERVLVYSCSLWNVFRLTPTP